MPDRIRARYRAPSVVDLVADEPGEAVVIVGGDEFAGERGGT